MPFSKFWGISQAKWTETYEHIFKPSIEGTGFGYSCNRSEIRNGAFIRDIVENLRKSHLVLADITGSNPNVIWELGVRHALSKRTILVTRKRRQERLITISNLSAYGIIKYDTSPTGIDEFKKRISKMLSDIEDDPDRNDNPVFDFFNEEDLLLSSLQRKRVVNLLTALFSELLSNLELADDILKGTSKVNNRRVTQRRFSYPAMTNLLMTNYAVLQDQDEEEWLLKLLGLTISFMALANKIMDSMTFTNTFPEKAIIAIDAKLLLEG